MFYRDGLSLQLGCGVASSQTRDKGLCPTGHEEDTCALCDEGCWGQLGLAASGGAVGSSSL